MPVQTVDDVMALLTTRAQHRYGLSDVSQLEHAEQSAALAVAQDGSDAFVIACLLHDIGHLLLPADRPTAADMGRDDHHELSGARILGRIFGAAVARPVGLHVAAKRYLCAAEPDYFAKLSPDSVRSLELQGGPMSPSECAEFTADPGHQAALDLRRIDEQAKVAGLAVPPFTDYRSAMHRLTAVRPAG